MENVKELWMEFGEIPMDAETECIEEEWHGFSAGTHREEIWHWFEETFNVSVAKDLMNLQEGKIMENIIKEMIMQADDERNLDLIRLIKEMIEEFAYIDIVFYQKLGIKLEKEYPKNSWVYKNLELWNFVD